MDSDPYKVLGVSESASASEIKKAYRKLALKNHPDKLPPGSSAQDKEQAEARFTAISNAYQILGDEEARKKYHRDQRDTHSNPTNSHFQNHRYQQADVNFGFVDPFEVFRQVFGQEFGFGNSHFNGGVPSNVHPNARSNMNRDPFSDPFFQSGFGGGGFGNAFGSAFSSGFGAGFGMMNQMMQNMDNHMHQGMNNMHHTSSQISHGGGGGSSSFVSSFSTSSSSSSRRSAGGVSESVSTKTQIINGKRTTVTERVKVYPDGRVERTVESHNDDQPTQRIQYNDGDYNDPSLMRRITRF